MRDESGLVTVSQKRGTSGRKRAVRPVLVVAGLALAVAGWTMRIAPGPVPATGPGASLHGRRVFPPDNPWNQDISGAPVDPRSDAIIASIGADKPVHPDFGSGLWQGAPNGIPYVVAPGS